MRFLLQYLAGITAIADALSAPGYGVRIYNRRAPANCPLPYVTISWIAGRPDYSLAGEIGDLAKVAQIDCYHETQQQADELAELIRLAPLSGFRGLMGETYVHAVTIEREVDPDDYRPDGTDQPYARASKDYSVHFDRPVVHSS